MAILALYGGGRILLHLLAMMGDGCFRFHGAGIMRELSGFATAATLLVRMPTRLASALALYFAKRANSPISATAARATKAWPERGSR
jgi:hypothetical protein